MLRIKPYLSYSQMTMFESSPEMYAKTYILGEKMRANKGMILGSKIADALENNTETGNIIEDFVLTGLPKFDLMDHTFKVTINVSGVEIPLLSRIDSAKQDLSGIKEYKTGLTPWSQKKVDDNTQITFYCTVAHAITGKIPEDIELCYMPSHYTSEGLELTGEIIRFPTKRTLTDIMKMKIRMKQAWLQIGELTEKILL